MKNYLALAIFISIVGAFLYRIVRYGGFKGALFGAQIARTLGEVEPESGFSRRRVRVHLLESDDPDNQIGLEVVTSTVGSYRMVPLSLSRGQALELSRLLSEAAHARSVA